MINVLLLTTDCSIAKDLPLPGQMEMDDKLGKEEGKKNNHKESLKWIYMLYVFSLQGYAVVYVYILKNVTAP